MREKKKKRKGNWREKKNSKKSKFGIKVFQHIS